MTDFKVGDKVRIKENFWELASPVGVSEPMKNYCGKIGIIELLSEYDGDTYVRFYVNQCDGTSLGGWNWSTKWLSLVGDSEFEIMNDVSRVFTEFKK